MQDNEEAEGKNGKRCLLLEGGGWRGVGLLAVMERPGEKVDGWREWGEGSRYEEGGLNDKRKIQTGQSFLFANRAPDKDSACSGADRGAISLPDSPLLLHPSASLTQQIVCEEERRKEQKKKSRALSVQHHGATINQPQCGN